MEVTNYDKALAAEDKVKIFNCKRTICFSMAEQTMVDDSYGSGFTSS